MRRNIFEMCLLFAAFYLPGMVIHQGVLQHAGSSPGRFMGEAILAAVPQLLLMLYVLWLRERERAGPQGPSSAAQRPSASGRDRPPPAGSPWQRFGLSRPRPVDLAAGALVFACALGLLLTINLALRLLPSGEPELLQEGFRFRLGDWRLIPLALVFGLVTGYREELFFRGYLITRFTDMGVPGAASVAASCLLFALGHLYQGAGGFLTALALGALFGVLFLRRRNLHRLAIAHALYNTLVLAASLWAPRS